MTTEAQATALRPPSRTGFPRELFPAPRDSAEQFFPKLIYWNEPERGGHFAAFEEPTLFAQEIRAFARKLR